MNKADLILKLKNLGCLSLGAIEIISSIINHDLKMEMMKSIQIKTSLGDINFKKGMKNLLENDILVWMPEKSHRKKALYYGQALLDLGVKQVVKSYVLEQKKKELNETRRANLAKFREERLARIKQEAEFENPVNAMHLTSWCKKGKTYSNPHAPNSHIDKDITHAPYLTNNVEGQRERFIKQYKTGLKISTAHLYRKAMAKFVPQNVPQ